MPCHHPVMASHVHVHVHVHVVVGRLSTGTHTGTRTRDLLDRRSSRSVLICWRSTRPPSLLVEPGARHARRPSGRPAQMHLRSARGVFPRLSLLASDEHGAIWSHVDLEMDPGDPEGDRVARLSLTCMPGQCIHTSTPGGPRSRCRCRCHGRCRCRCRCRHRHRPHASRQPHAPGPSCAAGLAVAANSP
jgi:hypothetical protein